MQFYFLGINNTIYKVLKKRCLHLDNSYLNTVAASVYIFLVSHLAVNNEDVHCVINSDESHLFATSKRLSSSSSSVLLRVCLSGVSLTSH